MAEKNSQTENAFIPKNRKYEEKSIHTDCKKEDKNVSHRLENKSIFTIYKPREEIARNIAKEMVNAIAYNPPLKEISKIEKYEEIINEGLTFFMSDESDKKRSGLLSICPATLTAMKLWDALPESQQRTRLLNNIQTGVDAIFKIVFRGNDHNLNEESPVFDASPYESGAFSKGLENGKSYIDSISWAVPVFLRILNMTENKYEKTSKGKKVLKEKTLVFSKELRDKAQFLADWCLRYINKSLIKSDDKPIGWNYTKLDEEKDVEHSLYFTYAASTVYLSFYAEYKDVILAERTLEEVPQKIEKKGQNQFRFDFSKRYWENEHDELGTAYKELEIIIKNLEKDKKVLLDKRKKDIEEAKSKQLDEESAEYLSENERLEDIRNSLEPLEKIRNALDVLFDPDNREKIKTLAGFNGNNKMTAKGKLERDIGKLSFLRSNLEYISKILWKNIKDDKLERAFMYEDPEATVADEKAIEKGGQTNALFTGLLQTGILLNSGYDLKVRDNKENDTQGQKEYENMQSAMLLNVQKTQRFFDKMEDNGKSFGVDSLILRFTEKVGKENEKGDKTRDMELAEKLRKHRIRVCSLTPMLLKTNNLISEYVIQYPQKQMGESLLRISQKRYKVKDKEEQDGREQEANQSSKAKDMNKWLWETDNYHAISNYYYVGAVFDFYAYYQQYEASYVQGYEEIRDELIKEAGDFVGPIREYYAYARDDAIDKIAESEAKHNTYKTTTNDELTEAKKARVAGDTFADAIRKSEFFKDPQFLKDFIEAIRAEFATEICEKYRKTGETDEKENKILENLKTPVEATDKTKLSSLVLALAGDVILSSAIEAKKDPDGEVKSLGVEWGNSRSPAESILKGRKGLMKEDNKQLNNIFGFMFKEITWSKDE